ncbi:MAG: DUF6273 domain-containing protein [Oscillospiraceae bacterium]
MKGTKRILSLCLALALLVSAVPTAFAAGGSVPENHWAHDVIVKWSDSGVLPDDSTLDPEHEMTAGELAGALARLFGSSAASVIEAAGGADASSAVTREQAIRYIAAAFGIDPVEGATSFADDAAIDPAYKPYVNAFQKLGYVHGKGGSRFDPKAGCTYAEAAQMLENVTADRGIPEQPDCALKAGAGASEITFDDAMFPVEGFNGEVHLNPYARVLVLEQGIKVAIVSLELVNVPSDTISALKEIVAAKTGTPVENIWVHATHAITTPHAPDDSAKRELYVQSVTKAVTEAAEQAAGTFQAAVMGVGTGTCEVNANRDIKIGDSWYYGLNSDMPSNKEMTIVSFKGLDGTPIGFFISYGVKPTAIDNSEKAAGTRKLSSDVPGVACRMMEEEFGVPAMFCMPAAGDQIPRETAMFYVEGEDGKAVEKDLGVEAGIEIVERLGDEMGSDAISIAKNITYTDEKQAIAVQDTSFTWPSKSGDGEVKIDVRGLTIGDDIAFVGIKPEVNAITEQELWEASPYKYTMILSFLDGDQKYMPDDESHDLQTWEFKRSGTAKGSAEKFVETAVDLLEDMKASAHSALKAGAGASEITFDDAMFPVEGFNGEVHLNPYARVLVLEQETKAAIVSLELVNVPSDVIASIKNIVSEKTGTPAENVWVHATHAITTPHAPDDSAKRELYVQSVTKAVTEAAEQAAGTFQAAVVGVGTGTCEVNANRDIKIGDSWYYGLNSDMPSNKEMTIVSFKGLDGTPIGFFISYGVKPTAIDNSEKAAGTRKLSSDVPGVACQLMEEEFGVPAMFCMPAAGDQIPRETAMFYVEDEDGKAVEKDLGVEAGIEIVERLGDEMGSDAISIAKSITYTDEKQSIVMADTSFTWPSKSGDGDVKIDVRGLTIGDDIAFVGIKPEVNAITEQELWEASPYKYTMILSFLDGDQKYMPDDESHDLQTWEFKRSGTAKGSAEKFVETAAELLEGIKSGEIKGNTGSGSETGTGGTEVKKTIQMGGYDWIVLDEQDGKMLVLSSKVLEARAYHSAGGAITWEDSEIRAYLNGEFYDKTFTDAEKAKIVETTVENKSNPQYGIPGGSDTTDKVFLLSLGEAEKYLGGGVELLRGIDISTGEVTWWHLRSPGEATDVNASVNAIGLIDYHGVSDGVKDPTGGVRPAMWITAD